MLTLLIMIIFKYKAKLLENTAADWANGILRNATNEFRYFMKSNFVGNYLSYFIQIKLLLLKDFKLGDIIN